MCMRAIVCNGFGEPTVLRISEVPKPIIRSNQMLVLVMATALNRADTLQRRGQYPPPPGESDILGLEYSGVVREVGTEAASAGWKIGERVFGLLGSGGYAEFVAVDYRMAMRLTSTLSFEQGAAIPEAFLTAFQALWWIADLSSHPNNNNVLIHAAASGVGLSAIQLVKRMGSDNKVIATAGEADKLKACMDVGADCAIDRYDPSKQGTDGRFLFSETVLQETGGRGVDVIIDFIGASYWDENLASLAVDGRMVMLALLGGGAASLNIASILKKRLRIEGSTLRSRDHEYKCRLTRAFEEYAKDMLADGRLRPIIDRVVSWADVVKAHTLMEHNKNIGKIVMVVHE